MSQPIVRRSFVTLAIVAVGLSAVWLYMASSRPTSSVAVVAPCHERDGLPDLVCTPGAISADVNQGTVQSTICTSGYTTQGVRSDGRPVRPPTSYTNRLKASGVLSYGYADRSLADYEEDHLIPLELGGDGWNPNNLWPEPRNGAHGAADKDQVENELHRLVCSGTLNLSAAQHAIAINWETAVSVAQSG